MKKALIAVALMMAAITGWCETTDWDYPGIDGEEDVFDWGEEEDEDWEPPETIWSKSTDWVQVYGLPTSQDWNRLEVYDLETRCTDIAEFEAIVVDVAEKAGFTSYYDFIFQPPLSGYSGTQCGSVERTAGDYSSAVNKAITMYGLSPANLILACSDTNLKEYLLVQIDENGNPQANTWNSFGAVPEPASGLLIVMGSVLLAFRRKVA